MTDYAFDARPAYYQGALLPGSTFTFTDNAGTPATIKNLAGATVASLTADAIGMAPGFIAVDVSVGFLVNAAGAKIPAQSTWAQDPAQVRSAVQAAADAAAGSAAAAAGAVSGVSTGLNLLGGRVTQLEQAGTAQPGITGAVTPQIIRASDYGGQWPSPHNRISGDPSYSVTFVGSIARPPLVDVGSADGMQPGDYYQQIVS